jgi:hypothetical protein
VVGYTIGSREVAGERRPVIKKKKKKMMMMIIIIPIKCARP